MKIKKILVFLLSCIILISCFSITSYAFLDEYNYVLDCKDFYIEIPEGYKNDESLNNQNYAFENELGEYIYIIKVPNAGLKSGLQKTDNQTIKNFYKSTFEKVVKNDYVNYDMDFNELYKEKFNGLWCCNVNGYYHLKKDVDDEAVFLNFSTCIAASMNDVYLVTYACDGSFFGSEDTIKDLVATMAIAGPYVKGEKYVGNHVFSSEKDFFDDIKNPNNGFYDDKEITDVSPEESVDYIGGMSEIFDVVLKIYPVLIFFFSILPTLILLIVFFIVLYNYNKNKKQLKEYTNRFGDIDFKNNYNNYQQNSYNGPMPQYDNQNMQGNAGSYTPPNNYNPQPNNFEQNQNFTNGQNNNL